MATKEVLGGLIEITLDLIDNVWRMQSHIKIQIRGHTDENDITNFGNVIFE
jgi:flagellar motor protein MotB